MIEIVEIKARLCTCDNKIDGKPCGHHWLSIATAAPAMCPLCGSRAWNGKKKLGRPVGLRDTTKFGLPKPKRVRDIGA